MTNVFEKLGQDVGKLVAEKQIAYGDSFGRSANVLMELYPNGIQPEQYGDLLTVARILDKLFRVANKKDAFGESPYKDICGYTLLGLKRDGEKDFGLVQDSKKEEAFEESEDWNVWHLYATKPYCRTVNIILTYWYAFLLHEYIGQGTIPLAEAEKVRDKMYKIMDNFTHYGARDTEPECALITKLETDFSLAYGELHR